MDTLSFALYILVWPIVSAGVLAMIWYGVIRDWRKARRDGHDLV